jgi:hypothetical protein
MKQMEINRTRKIKTIKIKGNINWEQKRKKYVVRLLLAANKRSTYRNCKHRKGFFSGLEKKTRRRVL